MSLSLNCMQPVFAFERSCHFYCLRCIMICNPARLFTWPCGCYNICSYFQWNSAALIFILAGFYVTSSVLCVCVLCICTTDLLWWTSCLRKQQSRPLKTWRQYVKISKSAQRKVAHILVSQLSLSSQCYHELMNTFTNHEVFEIKIKGKGCHTFSHSWVTVHSGLNTSLNICSFSDWLKCLWFMSCCRYDGKAFHTQGLAVEKLLSPKLLCVHGTTHIVSGHSFLWWILY